jgi:hypothetical protein
MKKLTYLFISILALACAACGNNEDDYSYPPTYEGFRMEPSVVYPGDSVHITAVQQRKGHYLNATTYSWTMTVDVTQPDGTIAKEDLYTSKSTNYGGLDSSDPTWGFYLPQNTVPGRYTCSFDARWSNSADGNGQAYNGGTGQGCVGTITSYSYTLYSQANGKFQIIVGEKP